jgi:TonB-dependent receptor
MNVPSFRLPRWAAACLRFGLFLTGLTALPAISIANGTIAGVVSDPSGSYIQGARVQVEGTALSTVTDRVGRYRITDAPAGSQRLTVDYLGYKPASASVEITDGAAAELDFALESEVIMLDAFTVESIREGQSRAINQQRTSNTISSIVSSDAIGNLPDHTVGDAIARLPGVTVVLDGRSAYASIRGAAAKFNSVTLDGSHLSSPANDGIFTTSGSETRAVDLSTIPSDMIAGIEVIKALTPDRDADAFGGQINLVTRSAFDLRERTINGSVDYLYNSLKPDGGYAFTLNYSDLINAARTLGVTATLSYSDEAYGQHDYEIAYYEKVGSPVEDIAGITDGAISEFDQRFRENEKESLGANLNFDFRPKDSPSEFYLRLFHNESDTEMDRWRLRQRGLTRVTADSTDALASGTEARLTRRLEDVLTERANDRITLGGKTNLNHGSLAYELNYSDASLDANARRYQFETASSSLRRTTIWTVDRSDPVFPQITMVHNTTGENVLFRDQDLALNLLRYQNINSEDKDLVAKLDYELEHPVGNIPVKWQTGVKYRGKDRNLDGALDDYAPVGTAPRQDAFASASEPTGLFDGRIATLGHFPTVDSVFADITANPANWVSSNLDESLVVATSRYDATEDIASAYAMGTAQFGKLETIAGVRFEQTKLDYTYRPTDTTRAKGDSSYDNFFPSFFVNYRFTPNLILRSGWTNTITRPDYGDLIPYETNYDPENTQDLDSGALVQIFRGNPDLRAQKSMNWDAAIEWYFQPTGMLSASIFRKDITDFIYKGVYTESRPPIVAAIYQNKNGADQDITGAELSWVQSLSMLPSPFDGFGFKLNATFVEGESTFPTLDVTTGATGTRTEDFIPLQPKRVYNAELWWEKYGFTARIALNYIGEYVREVGGLSGAVTNNEATRVDAQISYRINANLTLFAEGKNLTEEVKSWYTNRPDRPEEYEYSGWNGRAGVRFRF